MECKRLHGECCLYFRVNLTYSQREEKQLFITEMP